MAENKKYILTKKGYEELKKELDSLINIKRPEIIRQIAEARAEGDLSENADYDAAKAQQGVIESRIAEINDIIEHAEIISDTNSKKANNDETIRVGKTVKLINLSTKKEHTYTIVGTIEADPFNDMISNDSPIARSLSGHVAGDNVEIKGVENPYFVKVLEVKEH